VIDHVTIRVDDLTSSSRCYRLALELLELGEHVYDGGDFLEWNDFSIAAATPERPATRRLHVGFQAASREQVDRWWQEMTAAGYDDDGAPARGRSTVRTTTAASSSTPTATASKPSTTTPGPTTGA
jgi:catechol 2,3-dioxygenase-like lactoylglutathione lyase family enzyme